MDYITVKEMNNLLAYGAPDGVYNTVDYFMGKSDMHVVAIVKGGKVKVKGFKDMKEAIEWAEQQGEG